MPRKKAEVTQGGRASAEGHPVLNDDGSVEHDTHAEYQSPPGEDALNDYGNLRDLVFLGRAEKVVTIGKYKFRVSTITGTQQMTVISKAMLHNDHERLSRMRSATLAEAIVNVNGVPLEDLYEGPNVNMDVMSQRMSVIDGWQSSILDRLFTEYDELTRLSKDALEGDDLKK
jgi:hypothetical protein